MPLYRNILTAMALFAAFPFSQGYAHWHHGHGYCCDSTCSVSFEILPQTVWLDNGPLNDLIKKESSLRSRPFELRKKDPVFTLGLGTFADHGNGLRTGFVASGAYKSYASETFTGGIAGAKRDSVAVLRLIPVYGGITIEKACHFYGMTFSGGIMVGGGVFILHRKFYDVEESGAFVTVEEYDRDNDEDDDRDIVIEARNWAFAPTLAFDAHTGVSFELAPLLHLGIEAAALCFYSPEGYGYATGDFFTVNPCLRMRITIGKAG
jgi:hypothetical protein